MLSGHGGLWPKGGLIALLLATLSCWKPAAAPCAGTRLNIGVTEQMPSDAMDLYKQANQLTALLAYDFGHEASNAQDARRINHAVTRIDSAWSKNPKTTTWVLAWLVANRTLSGDLVANNAAYQYKRLSGGPQPMLSVVSDYAQDDQRRALGLEAIREGLSLTEQERVLALACDTWTRAHAGSGLPLDSLNGVRRIVSQGARLTTGEVRTRLLRLRSEQ